MVDEVVQVQPRSTGILGIPTLLLVDGKDRVTQEWSGFLSPRTQSEVMSELSRSLNMN